MGSIKVRLLSIKVLLLVSVMLSASYAGASGRTTEFQLDNGLQVIVKEDHRAPIAVTQIWYKVGASYEPDGLTGVSHVLEHMMFKGTKNTEPGEFSRIIAALGGRENAFTGRDYTAYFQTLSTQHLDRAFELEADRMRNMVVDPEEFAKELEVVKEERRLRTEDKPSGRTYEQFSAVAWRVSPYRNPVIGWMSDLDHLTPGDIERWYDLWYRPNNATLVVVGDVKPKEILALARKHFGAIPRADLPAGKPQLEPEQQGLTRVEVEVPARQPYLLMGFKTPILGTAEAEWEPYALYVLAAILDGGSSSRLSKELVRDQQLAASAGAEYSPYSRLPGLLLLDGTPTDGHSVVELEAALMQQVARLQDEPVSATELQRVVTGVIASKVYEKDSIFYQAMELGVLETIGLDWRIATQEVERIRAVTPEQIQSVARKYLKPANLTVATLKPLPMAQQQPRPRKPAGGRHGV